MTVFDDGALATINTLERVPIARVPSFLLRPPARRVPGKKRNGMTTFWLTFTDPEATSDKRFLGVVIFDMDEGEGELSTAEIIKHAYALGLNPGGTVSVQEVFHIPDEHKNKLITEDALLLRLGSRGRNPN